MERCVFKHIHNYLLERDKLKSLQRGDFKIWVASFNNLGLTASGPEALDMSKIFSISSTSFSVITIGKVMERCVFKHIHNYLLENNIIINNQSGFTKGDSAIYQHINEIFQF
jgi:hypothetical protein